MGAMHGAISMAMGALMLVLLPATALSRDTQDYEDDDEHNKDVSTANGHSLVIDLSSLGVLAALKLKFVVVLLIALAVFLLISKSYKTQCLFGNCRPNYSTYGYYPYVDYNYVGYEVPAAAYRRPHPNQLSDLTARVWNSIDLAGMAFSALNIHEDDCRRKLVCQADRAAESNPLLRAAMSWFSSSFARYRTDRSRVGTEPEWRQEDPCEEMYPHCVHRDLPPALGGPAPRPSAYHGHNVHDVEHDHLQAHVPGHVLVESIDESWLRPHSDFRNAYPYEYSHPYPVIEEVDEEAEGPAAVASPSPGTLPSSSTSEVAAKPNHVGAVVVDAVLESAGSAASKSTVLAPVGKDAPPAPSQHAAPSAPAAPSAWPSGTPSSSPPPGVVPGKTTTPWDGDKTPLEPRTRMPAEGNSSTRTVVWRRYRFKGAPSNHSKSLRE